VLDVTVDGDHARVRTGHAARSFATVRRAALNLIDSAPSPLAGKSKVSASRNRRIGGLDPVYTEAVLRITSAIPADS
jgi:hypothetical protein